MSGLRLAAIYRYPVKAARGLKENEAVADRFGLSGDRRWMLIDGEGEFVSQRQLPRLALLRAEPLADGGLALLLDGEHYAVQRPDGTAPYCTVRIWGDLVSALAATHEVSQWLSNRFGALLRLVYMPDDARRTVDTEYAQGGEQVAFADGFPLLLLTQGSLDALNAHLPQPVPMDRFRPNLVIEGAEPHAEDDWRSLRIGSARVDLVKPCARCVVPSIDQATALRDRDINRVLAATRRREGNVLFGMNGLAPEGARFCVGDAVTVLE